MFGLSKFLKQMFFASPVPKKKTWEAMRELYQERLRENHEVIGDIGRYNHADVDDDRQRLSNEKTLVSKQRVERSQN